MRASIFAGLAGIAPAACSLLIVFYRRLTLLIAAGMIVWGMLIYSVAVLISQTTNYALTLAGVTGIVVSIGMTVDSYVVYFERMKDEVLHGRTFKNSAARSFTSTWRTILAANLVSFIAAAVLFVLSVGSVRGFALYLGVTTICDVIVLWFFTRPAVILLAATGRLDRHDQFGHRDGPAGRRWTTSDVDDAPWRPSARPAGRSARPAGGGSSSARRPSTSGASAASGWPSRWPCWRSAALSLWQRGLVLGIDFEGGVAWDVPAGELTIDDARAVLDDAGIESDTAKIQERNSDSGDIIKVQVEDQPEAVRVEVQEAFAEAAGVDPADVSVASVSASWGEEITRKAVIALVVFLAPDRRVHLVPLRVAHGADRPAGDDPRRRHQHRDLLGVRLRGHPGDGRSPSSPCSATRCTTASSCSTASGTTSGASPPPG